MAVEPYENQLHDPGANVIVLEIPIRCMKGFSIHRHELNNVTGRSVSAVLLLRTELLKGYECAARSALYASHPAHTHLKGGVGG